MVVGLRSPSGRDLVHRLIATADVVVENWRPGVAEHLGFAAAEPRQRHPRLVTAAVRSFADTGRTGLGDVLEPITVAMVGEQPWTPLRRGAPEKGGHDEEVRAELESLERAGST